MIEATCLRRKRIEEKLPEILDHLRQTIKTCGSVVVCGQRITAILTDETGETVVEMEDADTGDTSIERLLQELNTVGDDQKSGDTQNDDH
ncbi:hypothetical protein [Zavarzinella formosa]|uniref:hypothetical protein n=1 Tax=Zavarzinella formosa TaxID=360055 RepID=UPI0002EC76CD|nr:hypothetical protein [Zavarzinella formosa]